MERAVTVAWLGHARGNGGRTTQPRLTRRCGVEYGALMRLPHIVPCLLFLYAPAATLAQTPEEPAGPSASFIMGYTQFDLGRFTHAHDTHRDDSFLPNAGTPGSAGTTQIDGPVHMAAFGLRYTVPLSSLIRGVSSNDVSPEGTGVRRVTDNLSFSGELGGLVG